MIQVWHGTNQEFDVFDPGRLGMNTDNASSRRAFYFADKPEVAWEYASFAARNMIPDQLAHEETVEKLIRAIDRANNMGDFARAEALTAQLEDLEFGAIQAAPAGEVLLHCEIRLDNPMEIDASGGHLIDDIGEVMDRARTNGHDGLIIRNIHDTPSGIGRACDHYAVFDHEAIQILERFHDLETVLRMEAEEIPELV